MIPFESIHLFFPFFVCELFANGKRRMIARDAQLEEAAKVKNILWINDRIGKRARWKMVRLWSKIWIDIHNSWYILCLTSRWKSDPFFSRQVDNDCIRHWHELLLFLAGEEKTLSNLEKIFPSFFSAFLSGLQSSILRHSHYYHLLSIVLNKLIGCYFHCLNRWICTAF